MARQGQTGRGWRIGTARMIGWGLAAALLLLQAVAMRFIDGMLWTARDFMLFGAMLLLAGSGFELAARASAHPAYRAGAGVAVVAASLLVWINLAVGIIGSENDPANLLYAGVLGIALVGALIARFRAARLVDTMIATAAAQLGAGSIAWLAGRAATLPLDLAFAALWLGAAWLFARAARASSE